MLAQLQHVGTRTGEEVVDAVHVTPCLDEKLAQVTADEPGAACDENSLHGLFLGLEES
jgi:hypothetical protein